MEYLSVAPLWWVPALNAYISLGWSGLSGRNTLAYYEKTKFFITLSPGDDDIKLFSGIY
jgi:hypothetical protein